MIQTRDKNGQPNGSVLLIWHADQGPQIDQVYLTTIYVGCMKGPHLHHVRRGLFKCIRGIVKIVCRVDSQYIEHLLTPGDDALTVPTGVPAALYNVGPCAAELLNMPSPPWRESEPDEHEVPDWNYVP